jgi:hypothetical protein
MIGAGAVLQSDIRVGANVRIAAGSVVRKSVPDGAIVLFSGMGPDAQEQLNVGVGALAGSTIMLLTIPWFLAVYSGRVNIVDGEPTYKGKKLDPPSNTSLTKTGVACGKEIKFNGKVMVGTAMLYLIIQVPATALKGETADQISTGEKWWAFAGLLLCVAAFFGYLWLQFRASTNEMKAVADHKLTDMRAKSIRGGLLHLPGAMAGVLEISHQGGGAAAKPTSEVSPLNAEANISVGGRRQMRALLQVTVFAPRRAHAHTLTAPPFVPSSFVRPLAHPCRCSRSSPRTTCPRTAVWTPPSSPPSSATCMSRAPRPRGSASSARATPTAAASSSSTSS